MNMNRIIKKIDEMAEKCIVTIDEIDRDYMDDASFTKGNYSFWIHHNNQEITLEIYKSEPYLRKDGKIVQAVREEGIYHHSTSEEFILKKLSEVINNKELYQERAKELQKEIRKVSDRVIHYTQKRNESTIDEHQKQYAECISRRLARHHKLSKEYLNCTQFEECTVLEKGKDDKVLVQWHREKSMMFPTGKEYSIHTQTSTGALLFGSYFMSEQICREEFSEKYSYNK